MEKELKIINKLKENSWDVVSCNFIRHEVVATKRWETITIKIEECLCHGGRMWITGEHSETHYEISHPTYDESLGIIDSSTELNWIIENEMMSYIDKLSTVVYKLVKINEWGKTNGINQEKAYYYGNMESLCYGICQTEDVKDLFLIDEIKYQCPNPDIYYVTKRIKKENQYSWEKNRIWFEQTRYERNKEKTGFNIIQNFEMYVDIFEKR